MIFNPNIIRSNKFLFNKLLKILEKYTQDQYLNKLPHGLLDFIYLRIRSNLKNRYEWRRNPIRTKKIFNNYYQHIMKYKSIDNQVILDLGCGKNNSLSIATAFLLNGAKKGYAIESNLSYNKLEINSEAISSGLYEMLLDCYAFKDEWLKVNNGKHFNYILEKIDMKSLANGEWIEGTKQLNIDLFGNGLNNAKIPKGYIDILVSHVVLEHIFNFKEEIKTIYDLMNNDSLMVHSVAFWDMRKFFKNKYNDWSFLYENKNYTDKYCNRLRVNEMKEIFDEVGFDVLEIIRKSKKIPENIYNKLDPHYKEMTKEDIETIQCVFIIRKP